MKKRISVLEDDESLRELFILLLEDEGYQVRTFPTVESFKNSLNEPIPDLFMLDVKLPDGDGMKVCTFVKTSLATKNTPVIMMSAHRNFEREHGECTAEAFIAKPFDISGMLAIIKRHITKA